VPIRLEKGRALMATPRGMRQGVAAIAMLLCWCSARGHLT
jgi:hypothetical protein